jgi:hypothetical protein
MRMFLRRSNGCSRHGIASLFSFFFNLFSCNDHKFVQLKNKSGRTGKSEMVDIRTKLMHMFFPGVVRTFYTKSRMLYAALLVLLVIAVTGIIVGSVALAKIETPPKIPFEKVVVIDNQEYIPLQAFACSR